MKIILYILLLILFASIFSKPLGLDPYILNPNQILLPPSYEHIFGTDRLGRDMFARVIEGTWISLMIGFSSGIIATLIGVIVGISAGYFRGGVDKAVVLIIDLFLTFPTFFLLLALVSYIDASSLVLIIVISITGWMGVARLIRSESFEISNKPFIRILNIAKVSKIKIYFKYYMPLLAPIFLVNFTFSVAGAILAESALSFLGLGIMPPDISWGLLISEGKEVLDIAWWVSFFPGMMIFIVTYMLIGYADIFQNRFNKKDKII